MPGRGAVHAFIPCDFVVRPEDFVPFVLPGDFVARGHEPALCSERCLRFRFEPCVPKWALAAENVAVRRSQAPVYARRE